MLDSVRDTWRYVHEQQDGKCTRKRNMTRSRNHWCRGKAVSITYSECVSVALVISHAKRMRCIILSYLPYFSFLFHKARFSGKSC
jgi:hypothetical protein